MKKYNFLIVDDIFINRFLLKVSLADISNEIKEAKNGLEAIEILRSSNIDIILMDIEMPKMNGLETTKYIRNEFPYPKNKLPIIALTAHDPDDFFDDFSNVGFNNLLTKPYSFEKILNAIESISK
ncbi:MAG: response regulator [Bacteroidales bacterium]|nr:response regulator [Bacteroidales bacterium]